MPKLVKTDSVELNDSNIPDETESKEKTIYRKHSLLEIILRKITFRASQIAPADVTMLLLSSLFIPVPFSLLFIDLSIIITGFILTLGIILFIIVMISIIVSNYDDQIYKDKVFIITDKYVVETLTGREEIDEEKKKYVRRDSLEDIKVMKSELRIKGYNNEIEMEGLDENSLKNIQDELLDIH